MRYYYLFSQGSCNVLRRWKVAKGEGDPLINPMHSMEMLRLSRRDSHQVGLSYKAQR